MESDCRAIIKVSGRVQGVGFRYSAFRMAQSLNLTGYVKNLPDGSVYLEAQGVRESVVTFIDWCRTGPRNAFVDSVEYSLHPAGELKIFQIR